MAPESSRPIGTIAAEIVAKSAQRRKMRELHEQSSIMHEALAEAISLEEDIESLDQELRDTAHLGTKNEISADLKRAQRNYEHQIAIAAMAVSKVEALCVELKIPHPLAAITKETK